MPRITAGVPLIVTVEGLREQHERPADTETRFHWEMALDHGEAFLTPIEEVYAASDGLRFVGEQFTHVLHTSTGGSFHVRVEEMDEPRQWPQIGVPSSLSAVMEMAAELQRMMRQMQTLLAANAELEAEVKRLKPFALDEDDI